MNASRSSRTGASPLGRFLLWVHGLVPLPSVEYLARRPRLLISLAGFSAFAGCLLYAAVNGIPRPSVHDEFSYLLAGDTFASGRLTNPTHPMWQHFETFHVLQRPSYASKYPPGQGIVLAIGQILGHPIVGVWLSVAFMAAGISWMLYQWVPPRWALLGSMLAVVQVGFPTYWAQSYWGGALAALGGALVFGALRAGATDPRLLHGILFGLGAMILAITRPLEGALAGLAAAAALAWLVGRAAREERARLLRAVIVPAAALIVATLGTTALYNRAVTGDPMRMPHQVYSQAYHLGAVFPWQEPSPIVDYRHDAIRDFKLKWSIERHEQQRQHFLAALLFKFLRLEGFFLGPGLLGLVMVPWLIRDRWLLLAGTVSALVLASVLLTLSALPHYAAPAAGPLLVLNLEGLRRLNGVRTDKVDGRRLVTLILLAYLPYLALRNPHVVGAAMSDFGDRRQEVLDSLESTDGNDLVIVVYGNDHNFHMEWVYNRAVIDSADVVWARDMSPEDNRELIRYFDDRRVWLLEVDDTARLEPYRD